jgi:hypothetical protein
MQQRTLSLSVREHGDTPHDRLDGVRVDDAFLDAGDEECSLTALEVVVKVDEESEERRLTRIWRRGIVLVGICGGVDS